MLVSKAIAVWVLGVVQVQGNGGHDMDGNVLPGLAPEELVMTTAGHLGDQVPTIPYWSEMSDEEKEGKNPPYMPPDGWIYNTSSGPVPGKINVHIVPHSHDDVGWQDTVDAYFSTEVMYIYDTLLERLEENSDRKFIAVEIGFFARWWYAMPESKKDRMAMVIKNGQLEFINGGWSMHDEACPSFIEMADNTMRGHQFIQKHFKIQPRGTWQIDPFGHTATQAWLLSYEAGMPSLFWGRMDWQDREMRFNATKQPIKGFEWLWQGSQSDPEAVIFAGNLYGSGSGGYATWFSFDGTDSQVQDDPQLKDYNVDQWVDKIVQDALTQYEHSVTEHQIWAAGGDFNYQNSDHWFTNLDKLIHYANLNGSVNLFYSTPTIYTDWKLKNPNLDYEVRTDDIMPLADDAHNYWTGFFTSRPALKRQVRKSTNLLAAARLLEVYANVTLDDVNAVLPDEERRPAPRVGDGFTDGLEGAVGLSTHHDAMSGTERQSVTDDYSLRMAEQSIVAETGISIAIQRLAELDDQHDLSHCNCNGAPHLTCSNASICAATVNASTGFTVYAWNPLASARNEVLRIPIDSSSKWRCLNADNELLETQLLSLDNRTLSIPLLYLNSFNMSQTEIYDAQAELANKAAQILAVKAHFPPLGLASISCSPQSTSQRLRHSTTPKFSMKTIKETTVVSNGKYELTIDESLKQITMLKNLVSGVETPFDISWGWYNSSVGGCTDYGDTYDSSLTLPPCADQKSGAYIFRPNSSELYGFAPDFEPTLEIIQESDIITEIRQQISPFASHVLRLYADESAIELEWTAGPIPVDTPWFDSVAFDTNTTEALPNNWGKELILKLSTNLSTQAKFAVDSNAREMIERVRDKRGPSYPDPYLISEPIAGNYYPGTWLAALYDEDASLSLALDAAAGVSSIQDGSLEIMVHRRVQDDDSRGVQEPLNETMCGCNDINAGPGEMGEFGHEGDGGCLCEGLTVRGSMWLAFDTPVNTNATRRQHALRLNYQPTLVFTSSPDAPSINFSTIAATLPSNVQLTTLTNNYASWNDGAWILRLSHLYQIDEHPTLSKPAAIDLAEIFSTSPFKIINATETTLTANQPKTRDSFQFPALNISAMQVRTFLAWFE